MGFFWGSQNSSETEGICPHKTSLQGKGFYNFGAWKVEGKKGTCPPPKEFFKQGFHQFWALEHFNNQRVLSPKPPLILHTIQKIIEELGAFFLQGGGEVVEWAWSWPTVDSGSAHWTPGWPPTPQPVGGVDLGRVQGNMRSTYFAYIDCIFWWFSGSCQFTHLPHIFRPVLDFFQPFEGHFLASSSHFRPFFFLQFCGHFGWLVMIFFGRK